MKTKTQKKGKVIALLLVIIMLFSLTACKSLLPEKKSESPATQKESTVTPIEINTSPDKYTHYIKNYVGKNCASFGYTSMSSQRFDNYGEALLEIIFISPEGNYIDIESEDALKEYSVVKQSIAPNSVFKIIFETDEDGNEYDYLLESQSYEEIVLCVKKNGESEQGSMELTEINSSPDKYTKYIVDYTGRNLAVCGYTSLGGNLMHRYGNGLVELIIVADDGSYVDPKNIEELKNYVVTGQNIAPNTELKLTYDTDSNGVEYDSLIDTQNIEEIELYVTRIASASAVKEPAETEKTTEQAEGLSSEFKEGMDAYEDFIEEYVSFMKKYMADPGDMSLLMDYAGYLDEYADMLEAFNEWESEGNMNDEELAYYIEVQSRVNQKLLEIN